MPLPLQRLAKRVENSVVGLSHGDAAAARRSPAAIWPFTFSRIEPGTRSSDVRVGWSAATVTTWLIEERCRFPEASGMMRRVPASSPGPISSSTSFSLY